MDINLKNVTTKNDGNSKNMIDSKTEKKNDYCLVKILFAVFCIETDAVYSIPKGIKLIS